MRVNFHGFRDCNVLGHIESSLLSLEFRNESLPPADARSQFNLRDAGSLARLNESLEQGLVEVGLTCTLCAKASPKQASSIAMTIETTNGFAESQFRGRNGT